MRLSGLSLAVILVVSPAVFAQHSSGGGSSGGSSSGGGGSHGSSSGGSSSGGSSSHSGTSSSGGSGSSHASSGSGHSYNGGGSVSRSSNAHGSNSAASSHSSGDRQKASSLHSNEQRSTRESTLRNPTRTEPPQKRTFFSFLRHPFRRPPAKPIANLRRPACFRGHCAAGCPIGQVASGGACVAARVRFEHNTCPPFKGWSGGGCLQETRFLDDCSALRRSMEQQQARMRSAESARQNACSSGSAQACSDASSAFSSEENLYRTFQARYQQCQQRSLRGYLFPGHNLSGFEPGLIFDPIGVDWSQP